LFNIGALATARACDSKSMQRSTSMRWNATAQSAAKAVFST